MIQFFRLKKIRQDPLSPTIFALCIEYSAIMLRQSTLYHGLLIGTELLKVSLFADDTVIYLNNSSFLFECAFKQQQKQQAITVNLKFNIF